MNVVIGFHKGDFAQAEVLAGRMAELGPYIGHSLVVYRDKSVPSGASPFSQPLGFDKVTEIEVTNDEWHKWPESPNNVFRTASVLFEYVIQTPWFLLEPDCVLLKKGWLDAISREYTLGAKPFMGCFVKGFRVERTDNNQTDFVPDHMSGVAVYPADTKSQAGAATMAHEVPWDVVGADYIVPNAHFTRLIQHNWRPPAFNGIADVKAELWPEAVIYHRDKSCALLALVRRMESGETGGPVSVPSFSTEPGSVTIAPQPTPKEQIQVSTEPIQAPETPQPSKKEPGILSAAPDDSWSTQVEAIATIREHCAALKAFADCPSHTRMVREELAFVGLVKGKKSRRNRKNARK